LLRRRGNNLVSRRCTIDPHNILGAAAAEKHITIADSGKAIVALTAIKRVRPTIGVVRLAREDTDEQVVVFATEVGIVPGTVLEAIGRSITPGVERVVAGITRDKRRLGGRVAVTTDIDTGQLLDCGLRLGGKFCKDDVLLIVKQNLVITLLKISLINLNGMVVLRLLHKK